MQKFGHLKTCTGNVPLFRFINTPLKIRLFLKIKPVTLLIFATLGT